MFWYLEQCNHGVVFLGIDVLLSNMFKDFGFVERGRNFTRQRAEIFHSVEMTKRQNMLLVRSMVMPFEREKKVSSFSCFRSPNPHCLLKAVGVNKKLRLEESKQEIKDDKHLSLVIRP